MSFKMYFLNSFPFEISVKIMPLIKSITLCNELCIWFGGKLFLYGYILVALLLISIKRPYLTGLETSWWLGGDSSLHWLRRRLRDVSWRLAGSQGSNGKFKHVNLSLFFLVRAQAIFWSPELPESPRGDWPVAVVDVSASEIGPWMAFIFSQFLISL